MEARSVAIAFGVLGVPVSIMAIIVGSFEKSPLVIAGGIVLLILFIREFARLSR